MLPKTALSREKLERWLSLAVDVAFELSGKPGRVFIALPKDVGETLIVAGVLTRRADGSTWFAHLGGEVEIIFGGETFIINVEI